MISMQAVQAADCNLAAAYQLCNLFDCSRVAKAAYKLDSNCRGRAASCWVQYHNSDS